MEKTNKEKKEKTVLENAVDEYKRLMEAAEYNAAKKLAKKFPEKFSELLKEEVNNKKKEEPYKKVDDKESEKESDEETPKKEDKKDSTMKNKKETEEKVVKEEREKDFTGDVENDTPNVEKKGKDGDPYEDKPKESKKDVKVAETKKEVNEEFDITDLDVDDAETAIDNADDEDEITFEEIQNEINDLESAEEVSDDEEFSISSLKDMLETALGKVQEMHSKGPTDDVVDDLHKGGEKINSKLIDEEEPAEEENEDDVDEAMGMAHSSSKQVAGDHLPGKEFAQHRHKRIGSFNNEGVLEKKYKSALEENKKLIKKFNEMKKQRKEVKSLVENYRTVLDKYRTQLKDMALFNTNLAHVNNLFINEELALTQQDKIDIIKGFKTINTIAESKEKYNNYLSEMKESKKTISETVEQKTNDSISSSAKNLDEIVETTAYENNEHVSRMKQIVEYVEKRSKSNNNLNG